MKCTEPVNKKEPITKSMLWNIVDRFGSDFRNLINLKICVLCLLGFSGVFFRNSELSELRMSDISFCDAYINVHIRQSKTDINRHGNSVVIAKTGNKLCPVFWLRRYMS